MQASSLGAGCSQQHLAILGQEHGHQTLLRGLRILCNGAMLPYTAWRCLFWGQQLQGPRLFPCHIRASSALGLHHSGTIPP